MAEHSKALGSMRFGPFDLSIETGELRKNGVRLKLSGQAIQVLVLLAATPGELVTREELQRKLWSGESFGDFEHGLNAAVNRLRETLGDSATDPKYIETVPRRGYRFIASLGMIASAKPEIEPPKLKTKPPKLRRWKLRAMIAVAGCAVAGLIYLQIKPHIERLERLVELQRLTVTPLTALPGVVISPTFSPDGSQVAFGWDGGTYGAGFDLYVKTIGTDRPVRLTHHSAFPLSAAWSPDGRSIAISRRAGEYDSGVYLVAPTGGPERQLVPGSGDLHRTNQISWSPDGKYLAFVSRPPKSSDPLNLLLFLLSMDTLEPSPVKTGCASVSSPSFSPRGAFLGWVCNDLSSNSSSLHLLRRSDGSVSQVIKQPGGIDAIAWLRDERRIVFSCLGDLWEVSLAQPSHAEKLPVGHDAYWLAMSPAGNRLAYAQTRFNVNIWHLDLLKSPPQAHKLVASSRRQIAPSISPDGRRIAFESDRTGGNEVWVCDADGSNALQLSSFGIQVTGTPRWSPDGKLIAFDSRVGGGSDKSNIGDESNIYVVDPQGGPPRKLSIDMKGEQPSWSHDGHWIYFSHGDDTFNPTVWKVPSTGGHAVQVAQPPATFQMESPDGQYLYFVRNQSLWRLRTSGSPEEEVKGMPELTGLGSGWFPVQSGIYYVAIHNNKPEIDFLDLNTRETRQVFALEKPPPEWMGGMPVSSDGKWLLYPQVDEISSDLMMIENWQ